MSDNHTNGIGNGAGPISGTTVAARLAERTLSGDLRDQVLSLVRRQRQPWSMLSEEQQTRVVEEIDEFVWPIVTQAVGIIAGRDFASITARVRDCKAGEKGIEAKLALASHDPNRHELMDSVGSTILIVLADPAIYRGARGLAAIDRDEPELPLPEEPPAESAAVEPADGGAPAGDNPGPYNRGYSEFNAGLDSASSPFDLDAEYPKAMLWQAGWHQAEIDSLKGQTAEQQTAIASAAALFRQEGHIAAEEDLSATVDGQVATPNPLEPWMPAHKYWNEGYFGDAQPETPSGAMEPKKRGRPRKNPNGEDRPSAI